MLTHKDLNAIVDRCEKSSPGLWNILGLEVKNNELRLHGNWPEEYDEANYNFILNAKNDIANLIKEIDYYKMLLDENQYVINSQELVIERLQKKMLKLNASQPKEI
jgi:hypothetical protein